MHTHPRLGDILANAITHGIGAVLALVGAVYLIAVSLRGTAWQAISCAVFAATLVLVYLCSTLYTRWCAPGRGMCFMCSITPPSTC